MLQGAATDGMQIDDPVAGSMWRPFSLSLLILPFAILQLTEAGYPGTAFFGGSGRRENCSDLLEYCVKRTTKSVCT